ADPINFVTVVYPPTGKATTGTTPEQYNIYLQSNYNTKDEDLTDLFNPDVIKLGIVKFKGQQVYYLEQAADYVPFPTATSAPNLPAALVGLTNQQMFTTYGLAIGGIVAPVTAAQGAVAGIHGIVGPASTYLPQLALVSKKYTQFTQNASDASNNWSKV